MIASSPLLRGLQCHLLIASHHSVEAIEYLSWAEQQLTDSGFQVFSSISPGDVESTLLNYCTQQDMQLLTMGAYRHSRIRQFLVGSTTTHILAQATLPLLLLR